MTHIHLPWTPEWLFWAYPWVWALALLPLLPLLWWWWQRGRGSAVRYSSLAALRTAGGNWRRRLRLVLPALRTVALGALLVAAARPESPNESRSIIVEGIAIQMVVDTSWSMTDEDLSPPGQSQTRLDVVKHVFREFVDGNDGDLQGRPNDLIGMIRFATYADSICPLTLDHDALLDALDQVEIPVDRLGRPLMEARSTAVGDGLALAVERLKDLHRTSGSGEQFRIKSRIVILLTDGENNAGIITPEQAGKLAATCGIKVYTVLAGTGERTPFGRRPVDDTDLREIAQVTGGKYYQARDPQALEQIYADIDHLERTKNEERHYIDWHELAWPWLMVAFVGLGLQMLLDATVLRKLP